MAYRLAFGRLVLTFSGDGAWDRGTRFCRLNGVGYGSLREVL